MAHVHVVIVGLARRGQEPAEKRLFSYEKVDGDPVESRHAALSPYLLGAEQVTDRHLVVRETSRPLTPRPKLIIGSKPIDGGWLIFEEDERKALIASEPTAATFLRPFIGAVDYINGRRRWIVAAQGASLSDLKDAPTVLERIRAVRAFREGKLPPRGKSEENARPRGISSKALAATPTQYHVTVIPEQSFLALPEVSSSRREYIPLGWLGPPIIPSNKLRLMVNATKWEFAVLTSAMHMSWVGNIGGRLKSDFQYGIGVIYNTFPWPTATPANRKKVEALAQAVLAARAVHSDATLADLYDPDLMPPDLRRAHKRLDEAVDRLYRRAPFTGDRDRAEHLFGLYEKLTAGLLATPAKPPRRRIAAAKVPV